MTGRTMWLAQDSARHRRGLMVELQDEYGALALAVDVVLCSRAKEQNSAGSIREGFAAIAREAGLRDQTAEVRQFMERANDVGWLDDLTVDDDGRRFRCRVSGWREDQDKAFASWRKAKQRADLQAEPAVTDRDMSRQVTECPTTAQHSTAQHKGTTSSELAKATPDQLRLSHLLADLVRQRDPKAKVAPEADAWLRPMRLLLADRDGDADDVERVLRWSQTDPFWQTNILCPEKLRKQFTQLTIKCKAAPIRTAVVDTAAPTRWADRAREWAAEDATTASDEAAA